MSRFAIRVSGSAGFCWGVKRALELAEEATAGATPPLHTLGPLIHNPTVIAELASRGLEVIDDPAQKSAGTVIIRSHGVEREVLADLATRGVEIIDATCTFVKAAQEKAARLRDAGYLVIVLGETAHPEVRGILSYAGPRSLVVASPDDLPADLTSNRVGVVVQTTQSQQRLAELAAALAPRTRELLIHNTICNATEERQEEAIALARLSDVVIVVGGRNSGNTTRLAELSAAVQPRTYHIESARELNEGWFDDAATVGVTAGASTPPDQIDAVVRRLQELGA